MQKRTYEGIVYALFDKKKSVVRTKYNQESEDPDAYLKHGVAAERWKNGRSEVLRQFITDMHTEEAALGDITAKALVNLAAEMAKKYK